MDAQVVAAFGTGVGFLLALLIIACYISFRRTPNPIPPEAMFIFRVILALSAAGFAAVLPGFLELEGKLLSLTVRAAGSLATFLIIYNVNPPAQIGKRRIPKPKPPRRVHVPDNLINKDDEVK